MFRKKCEKCGNTDEKSLVKHHINGNRDNNQTSNIKILCANCHMALHKEPLSETNIISEAENALARFTQNRHAIMVNSGTAALHLALAAIGVKEGDEVITTPYSFVASTNCILYQRATPIFHDIISKKVPLLDSKGIYKKINENKIEGRQIIQQGIR